MAEEKRKALDCAIEQINKQYGKGSIMTLGDTTDLEIETFPSGSLALDIALGVGGIPRGRIIEMYGPESGGKTTLALHSVAEIQKHGGIAAFVDAEHALDPSYAKSIGVDVENLYISQPDNGEQALEITEMLVRSGAIDLIVVDSVAALVPKAEIDGDMGDSHVGLQARLMSQALRKLTPIVSKSRCTVIFINQLREKVGVMFGCLHADTVIPFTDGRSFTIREIVEKQIKGSVWSYNEETKKFEEKEIIDWHYNGDVFDNSDYIHIETGLMDATNGIAGITVTPNHRVMTENGWKEARELTTQDKILSKYHSTIGGTLESFLYGMCCGDSHLAIRDKNTASLRIQDTANSDYVNWKINKLSPFYDFSLVIVNGKKRYQTKYTSEFAVLKRTVGERNPLVMLKNHYSDMALAIWYMDDGCLDLKNSHRRSAISIKRFKNVPTILNEIANELGKIGLSCTVDKSDGSLRFNKESTKQLMKKIARFVPECMQYKLLPEFRGQYEEFTLESFESSKEEYMPIRMIRHASDKQMRQRGKYDLSIKDNHNYLAGGITNGLLVHNSPETTTGGRALKFYSSIRLDIRRIETIKKDGNCVSNRVRIKVVKNKVAPPFKEAITEIAFGRGIDSIGELIDIACSYNIIEKSGAWFTLPNGERFQGRENVKEYLDSHTDVLEELNKLTREKCFN